jgi:hypothetical protein
MLFVFEGALLLVVLIKLTLWLFSFAKNNGYWLFGCVYFLPVFMFRGEFQLFWAHFPSISLLSMCPM